MNWFGVPGSGFRVSRLVPGSGFRVPGFGPVRVRGSRFRVRCWPWFCAYARFRSQFSSRRRLRSKRRSSAATRVSDRRCHCHRQAGAAGRGLDRGRLHVTEDGEPQTSSSSHFSGWRRAPMPAPRRCRPPPVRAAARRCRRPAARSAAPSPGDVRYRDRRLVVLYFDLTAMPPPDQMRALQGGAQVHRRADERRRTSSRS